MQELVRHFWKRWLREWLPSLVRRPRWNTIRDNIKVDDVVSVIDANLPRGQWSIGRIEEVYAGADGHVRSVKVKSKGSSYVRPIVKVCPMELSEC